MKFCLAGSLMGSSALTLVFRTGHNWLRVSLSFCVSQDDIAECWHLAANFWIGEGGPKNRSRRWYWRHRLYHLAAETLVICSNTFSLPLPDRGRGRGPKCWISTSFWIPPPSKPHDKQWIPANWFSNLESLPPPAWTLARGPTHFAMLRWRRSMAI